MSARGGLSVDERLGGEAAVAVAAAAAGVCVCVCVCVCVKSVSDSVHNDLQNDDPGESVSNSFL